jgi:energy-coupling factor transporter ATP-binding protein EcfA2
MVCVFFPHCFKGGGKNNMHMVFAMANLRLKYNPGFLSEDELQSSFVVREKELELLLRIIRDNDGESNQHALIIGPRGSGKTTLLLRTAMAVRQDKELDLRWYPVIFSEESYSVVSPGEFWLESLFRLMEQTGDAALKAAYEDLRRDNDEERLRKRALLQILEFADAEGKRLLLIVENLNMLLGDQLKDDDAWKIRETLIHEPRIMLLGSAVSRFDEIDNVDKAMFEIFTILDLPALSDNECDKIWANIAGSSLSEGQIRPIRILTGGNPRLLTIIAGFGMQHSFKDLMDRVVQLIDDHTEYFKSHLDSMAPTERKVYLALAELWDPSTARDIAHTARVDVNTTSALLQRLVSRKAVRIEGTKKNRRYVVAERVYNIYHLMRRRSSANRVKFAVDFMVAFYGRPEKAAEQIQREINMLPSEQCDDHRLIFAVKERRASVLYGKAENCARRAAQRNPQNATVQHILACLLCLRGKGAEALPPAKAFLADSHHISDNLDSAIELFTMLAAAGQAKEALIMLENAVVAPLFEPLLAALRLHLGQSVTVARELREVAQDVWEQIQKIAREIQQRDDDL